MLKQHLVSQAKPRLSLVLRIFDPVFGTTAIAFVVPAALLAFADKVPLTVKVPEMLSLIAPPPRPTLGLEAPEPRVTGSDAEP